MPYFPNHPQRISLNDEAHARPFESINSPARLSYLAYLNHSVSYDDDLAWISGLCQQQSLCCRFRRIPLQMGAPL